MYTHVSDKKWLMISGKGSWAEEVQSGSDFIDTSRHEHHLHALTSHTHSEVHTTPTHTHTHTHTQEHTPILISTCDTVPLVLFTIWCLSSVRQQQCEWEREREGGAQSQGEQSEAGTPAQRALYSFRSACAIVGQHGAAFDSSHYNK